jgi:preprotein translocase subunit SecA
MKEEGIGADTLRDLERWVLLRTLDSKWRDHLYEMDYLREGIGLRALAQKDPLVEYKNEGYNMFGSMLDSIQEDFVRYIFHLEVVRQEEEAAPRPVQLAYSGGGGVPPAAGFTGRAAAAAPRGMEDGSAKAFHHAQQATRGVTAPRRVDQKVGRNDPCPCGSGKKYKKCCGA